MAKRMSIEKRAELVKDLLEFKLSDSKENWMTLAEVREIVIDTGLSPNSKKSIDSVIELLLSHTLIPASELNVIVDDEQVKTLTYQLKGE